MKKIVVTGGKGFLGSFVVKELERKGYSSIFVPRHEDYDLVQMGAVERLYDDAKPDIVIHLAAEVGGIGANMRNQGRFFYANLMMGVQVLEVGRLRGLEKFVSVGTVCSYPKITPVPFKEEDLWNGYPEETNAPYGMAKKMMLVMSSVYRKQYGVNAVSLIPVNLYGPGDNFDLETAHVIPAMIRKCFDAIAQNKKELLLWGTGTASREFIYVKDAAEAIVLAMEKLNSSDPINLGTGVEIKIADLAALIAEISGFKGKIIWDSSKPDGQPRRCLDTQRAEKYLGFKAKTSFRTGLQETIDWYRKQKS